MRAFRRWLRDRIVARRQPHRARALEMAISVGSCLFAALILNDLAWATVSDHAAAPTLIGILGAFVASTTAATREDPMAPIGEILASLRSGLSPRAVCRAVIAALVRLTDARRAIISLRSRASGRLWSAEFMRTAGGQTDPALRRLPRGASSTYFFPWCSSTALPASAASPGERASDEAVRIVRMDARSAVPDPFTAAHPYRVMCAIAFPCGDGWDGRLFLLDHRRNMGGQRFMRTFEQMLQYLLPAAVAVCDIHALQREAATRERARIRRDLHDGIVQQLVCVDLELELLRHQLEANGDGAAKVALLQEQLRSELCGLRALLDSHTGR
jgi:signal transduction histidine kinase